MEEEKNNNTALLDKKNKKKRIIIIIAIICILLLIGVCITTSFSNLFKNENKKELMKYVILFDSNGGNTVEKQIVNKNDKVKEPDIPKKDNYVFIGWYLNDNLYDFSKPVNTNFKLIAKWDKLESDEVIITFNSDGGTSIQNQIIKMGEKVSKPDDPTKENNTFLGWYLNDALYDFNAEVNENITIIAKWKKQKVDINDKNVSTKQTKDTDKTEVQPKTETPKKEVTTTKQNISIQKPDKVQGVKVIYKENGEVEVNYSKVSSATGYELYRSKSEGSGYELLENIYGYHTYYGKLNTSQTYYYKIRAYSINGENKVYGDYSDIVNVPARITSPTNVYFKGIYKATTSGELKITYASSGADNYLIYHSSTEDDGSFSLLQSANITSVTTSWYPTASYYKIVSKKTGTGYEMYSSSNRKYYIPNLGIIKNYNVVSTRSKIIVSPTQTQYNYKTDYSWNAISNVDGYKIQYFNNSYCANGGPVETFNKDVLSYTSNSSVSYTTLTGFKTSDYYSLESSSGCKAPTLIDY